MSGLGALLAACTSGTTAPHRKASTTPSFPSATTTGPAAGGYPIASLTPVDLAVLNGTDINDNNYTRFPWIQKQADGTLLIERIDFSYHTAGDGGSVVFYLKTSHPVEFRGCRITAMDQSVINTYSPVPSMVVSYCQIRGDQNQPLRGRIQCGLGLSTPNVEIHHCDISGWEYGTNYAYGADNGYFHDNYVHDPVFETGDHTDGLQVGAGNSATDTLSKIRIINNTILDSAREGTSAINCSQYDSRITIQGNLLGGGVYMIYVDSGYTGSLGRATNVNEVISGNYFTTAYFPHSGKASYATAFPNFGVDGNVWRDNYWYDGPDAGKLVPAQPNAADR